MPITINDCIHCDSEAKMGRNLSKWGINTIVCSNEMCDATMLVSTDPDGIVKDWNKLNTPNKDSANRRQNDLSI